MVIYSVLPRNKPQKLFIPLNLLKGELFSDIVYEIWFIFLLKMTLDELAYNSNFIIRNKILLSLSSVLLASLLISAQSTFAARSFQLSVNLWDGDSDSGKVKVFVYSHDTGKTKFKNVDVGTLAGRSGDINMENILFLFLDKDLPLNGEFSACAYSIKYDKTQCENAERHHDASSAVMWLQIPG